LFGAEPSTGTGETTQVQHMPQCGPLQRRGGVSVNDRCNDQPVTHQRHMADTAKIITNQHRHDDKSETEH